MGNNKGATMAKRGIITEYNEQTGEWEIADNQDHDAALDILIESRDADDAQGQDDD